MEDNNVLSGGTEVLKEIRESLVSLETMRQRVKELEAAEKKLQTDIEIKEKMIEDEIYLTVKKRQIEIEESFNGQIDSTKQRIKKVKSNRDKEKGAKVSERIKHETAEVVEEKRKLRQDLRELFRVHGIPVVFNNSLFFALFMPSEPLDFLVIALCILCLWAVPFVITLLVSAETATLMFKILLYSFVVILAAGIYYLIFKYVRTKHRDALKEARKLRNSIRRNAKQEAAMGRAIRKDSDESSYGLQQYDEELAQLEQQMLGISESKKEALTNFENRTKLDIAEGIRARHIQELDGLKQTYESDYEEAKRLGEQINSAVMEISGKYEPYIGKEALSLSTIDALIEIINTGDALTISDAIAVYEARRNAAKEGI